MMGGIVLAAIQILPHGLVVSESVGVIVRVGVVVHVGVVVGMDVIVGLDVIVGVGVVLLVLKCFFYLLLELPCFFCPHKNRWAHKRIW